jgi:hypothetical protein
MLVEQFSRVFLPSIVRNGSALIAPAVKNDA